MTKALLGLMTCHRYDYRMGRMRHYLNHPVLDRRSAIRETWLQDVDIDFKWFFGAIPDDMPHREPEPDEVFLDVPDSYLYLVLKVKAMVKWALDHDYSRIFKVDDDVMIQWDKFKQNKPYWEADYAGWCEPPTTFAIGPCYAMAGPMMHAVVNTPVTSNTFGDDADNGDIAKAHGIKIAQASGVHWGPVNPRTQEQWVEDSTVEQGGDYCVLSPMKPDQIRRYYELHHNK